MKTISFTTVKKNGKVVYEDIAVAVNHITSLTLDKEDYSTTVRLSCGLELVTMLDYQIFLRAMNGQEEE
ncbi:hypothetical protein B0A67_16255 [Flavobacterium aquidurense]|uniref:hypothetical protein n=1 Tax=Flavobacterium aquidurense TaxID=362413 RepID=UPI00091C74AB|nr:hypothetical protein [Flavobacterium aquidurense]OXA70342.1 hypothetical protein B0A67_16255 [Flavobacterium aquidurense]SHH33639.1 hypothetical protein SAMN05444481_11561 [Flavobacterium frigidimaris]